MVNRLRLFDTTNHYINFFEEIISRSEIIGDINRAEYGLKEAREIKKILDNNSILSNLHLKKIHSQFSNMTRGVEYFDEYEMEKRRRLLGSEILLAKMDLEKHIKW